MGQEYNAIEVYEKINNEFYKIKYTILKGTHVLVFQGPELRAVDRITEKDVTYTAQDMITDQDKNRLDSANSGYFERHMVFKLPENSLGYRFLSCLHERLTISS